MNLINPVMRRELIENLRRPRAFVVQAVFLALLSALVLIAWPAEMEIERKEAISRTLYHTFALGQLALLALLAPVFSASSVAGERERRTFDLLKCAPLSAWSITWGKYLGAVTQLGLLAFSSLPLFSLSYQLGAVGPREVAATYAVLLSVAALGGAVGLAAGTFLGRSHAALAASYAALLPVTLALLALNPTTTPRWAWPLAAGGTAASAALLILVARRLARPFDVAPSGLDAECQDDMLGLTLDNRRFPDRYLIPGGADKPIPAHVNPVFVKELRYGLFGLGSFLVRLLLQVSLIAAVPFLLASIAFLSSSGRGVWLYTTYLIGMILVLGPSLAGGVFTQEREQGTLDLLTTSGLGKRRILFGKLAAQARTLGLLTVFLSVSYGMLALFSWRIGGGFTAEVGLATLLLLLAAGALAVLIPAFGSLVCRTTLRSLVWSSSVLAAIFVLPVAAYFVATRLAGVADADTRAWTWLSPFWVASQIENVSWAPGRRGEAAAGVPWATLARHLALAAGASGLALLGLWRGFDRFARFRHDQGR